MLPTHLKLFLWPVAQEQNKNFLTQLFFRCRQKTILEPSRKHLQLQLHLIIYADHYEKTIIKDKKPSTTTKNSVFNPFNFFRRQLLFAYFPLFIVVVFFDRGPRREWDDEPGNKRVLRGSEAIVWCVFYPHVSLCGFFMRCVERPEKKYIWIIFLKERVILFSSVRLIMFLFELTAFLSSILCK